MSALRRYCGKGNQEAEKAAEARKWRQEEEEVFKEVEEVTFVQALTDLLSYYI